MRRRTLALAMLVLGAFVLGGCTAAEPTAESAEKGAVPVEMAAVAEGVVEEKASLTGKFYPSKEVRVAPKINGKIASIDVDLGQEVSQGDVLFRLDQSDLQTAVRQAEASYQSALANLNQTEVSIDQSLAQAENALKQAKQSYEDQKKELDRTTELFQASFVSEQQLEQARSAFQNAEISLNNAEKSLEAARKKSGLEVARASVQQAKVSVDSARADLANAAVTAPISGVVSLKSSNLGEFASPQASVITIVDTSTLLVKVNVSEGEITSVNVGDAVEVNVPSIGRTLEAGIRSVSPVMDQQVKAYPVEIAIPNPGNELKIDMIAEVRFKGGEAAQQSSLVVPRSAVLDEGGKRYVYKVENNKAVKVEIVAGKESGGLTEIVSGVSLNDQVVTKGITLLSDGDEVSVQ